MKEKKPRIGVGVVVTRDGKILLGKRKGSHGAGQWSTAGGHLEFGEGIEECAKRELEEETGLLALSLKPGPWTENVMDSDKHYITFFVFVSSFEGEPLLLEQEKCEGWHWFSWDELPSPLFASVSSLVSKIGIEDLKRISDDASFLSFEKINA